MSVEVLMPEVDFAADPVYDLEDRLALLRDEGHRIAPVRWKNETAWMVLRYKDVYKSMSDDKAIPAAPEYIQNWDTQGAQPLKMEGAEHRSCRSMLEVPFKVGEVRRMVGDLLLPLADELIDDFGSRREVDLIHDYTRRYGFLVMSKVLGVPVDEEERLVALVYTLLQGGGLPGADTPEARRQASLKAVAEMNTYLRPTIEARKIEPRDDMISYLLRTEEGGRPISEETVYDYVRFLYPAGAETTHLAMGRMMNNVLSDLSLRDRLIANPAERAAVVDESLRITPASNLVPRILVKDTVLCDVTVPAGATVLFSIASANRDPEIFEDPDTFSIDTKRKPTLSFGMGAHHCMGMHLAKAELLASLGRLLDRLPGLRLVGTPPAPMGAFIRWLPELRVEFDDILPASV